MLLVAVLSLTFCQNIEASPVSKSDLIELGKRAFYQKALGVSPKSISSALKDYYFIEDNNVPIMAVLNFEDGFIVMSADDVALPVLAYGFESTLNAEDMAPGAAFWLEEYKREILYSIRNGISPDESVQQEWAALWQNAPKSVTEVVVSPLLHSQWNQTKFYNRYSPIDTASGSAYDNRTPNGCVAVAMAQIMYYYRYPEHGYGSHTNYTNYGSFTVNFAQEHYNFDVMLDALSGANNEVAKLIFDCATSVDMSYSADGSGAYSEDVPSAISTYFGYSSEAQITYKSGSNTQWRNMLKQELDAMRPLYYSGQSNDGGHAFVCDGYNSDNTFHFNFGWGGSSDGFYVTSSTGGGSSNAVGGFSHSQAAIRNFYPADEDYPYFCNSRVIKASSGTLEDGSGIQEYQNDLSCTYVITEDSAYMVYVTIDDFETEAGNDSVSFWNGNPSNGNLLLTLSGHVDNGSFYSFETDSLYVTFNTNGSVTNEGWRFSFQVYRHVNGCATAQIHDAFGTISDGSGSAPYKSNANCSWLLRITDATYITFTFDSLDLSPEDVVEFYDTRTTPKTFLFSYTGNVLPEPFTVNSSMILVKFISDNYLNADGFVLSWTSDGSVYSHDDVESYAEDALKVFPNPASQMITIRLPESQSAGKLGIFDIMGRQIMDLSGQNSGKDILQVNVNSLSNGIYFIVYKNVNGVYKQKMIVAR